MATEGRKKRTRAEILHDRRYKEVRREFAIGNMGELMRGYLTYCGIIPREELMQDAEGDSREGGSERQRRSAAVKGERTVRLPNPAGFCRFLELERDAYARLEAEFPTEVGRMRAIFEDEALNSALPASVLGIYLKSVFSGDEEDAEDGGKEGGEITVTFAHDILADGR